MKTGLSLIAGLLFRALLSVVCGPPAGSRRAVEAPGTIARLHTSLKRLLQRRGHVEVYASTAPWQWGAPRHMLCASTQAHPGPMRRVLPVNERTHTDAPGNQLPVPRSLLDDAHLLCVRRLDLDSVHRDD